MQYAAPVRLTELLRQINAWERFGWILAGVAIFLIYCLGIASAETFANVAWKFGYGLALLQSMRIAWQFELGVSAARRLPTLALLFLSVAGLIAAIVFSSLSLAIVSCGLLIAAFACSYERTFTWLHGLTILFGAWLFSLNKPALSVIERRFIEASTSSISPILDFFGIPNMSFVNAIQTKNQWIDVGAHCAGLGTLAWLVWLAIVYLQHRPRSLIVTLSYSILLIPVAISIHFVWVLLTVWFGPEGDYDLKFRFSATSLAWLIVNSILGLVFMRYLRLLWLPIRLPQRAPEQGLGIQLFNNLVSWPNRFESPWLPSPANSETVRTKEAQLSVPEATPTEAPRDAVDEHKNEDEAEDFMVESEFSPVRIGVLLVWLTVASIAAANLGLKYFSSSVGAPVWTEIASERLRKGGYGEARSVQSIRSRPNDETSLTNNAVEHVIATEEISASIYLVPNRNADEFSKWILEQFHAVSAPAIDRSADVVPTPIIARETFSAAPEPPLPAGQYYYQFFPKNQYLYAWTRDVSRHEDRLVFSSKSWWDRCRDILVAWTRNVPLDADFGCIGFVIQTIAPIRTSDIQTMQPTLDAILDRLESSTP